MVVNSTDKNTQAIRECASYRKQSYKEVSWASLVSQDQKLALRLPTRYVLSTGNLEMN